MELSAYLRILWRRKWIILSTLLMVLAITITGTWLMPPTYRAAAKLHMTTVTRGSLDWVDYEISYAERLMNTYVDVAHSGPVRQELARRLEISVDDLPDVDVQIVANTELMRITAEAEDPALAYRAANALANIIVSQSRVLSSKTELVRQETLIRELAELETELGQAQQAYDGLDQGTSTEQRAILTAELDAKQALYTTLTEMYKQAQIREVMLANTLSLISPAEEPRSPVWPNLPLNLALGGFVGLIGGLGLAFLFENLAMEFYSERLAALVEQNPRALGQFFTEWNIPRLAEQMEKETGVRLSSSRMRALLEELGYDRREYISQNKTPSAYVPNQDETGEVVRRIPIYPRAHKESNTSSKLSGQVALWRKRSS